jgi:hypothetical protein
VKTTTTRPPAKRKGVATGRRRFNGELLDVAGAAGLLGVTEKAVRGRVARRLLPHRKLNGRVVLIRRELIEFLDGLPGTTVAEALANAKKGAEPA